MGASKLPKKILARQQEITAAFLLHVDQHLDDILSGKAADMFEIRDFAALQFIHPTHLSNTIKLSTGKSPCDFMEARIMDISRAMLRDTRQPVAEIAARLTFDPSNFTKFFKRFEGMTPKQYREQWLQQAHSPVKKTETVTI
ncbi:AraC family transcriptional regulator [uncultured Chitinophaga sp.]|jgi:AraC-type DNA-binding domain-containing proteins|uniref:helix-turn-helix domain-containing protein n=1 Tax=uncultured Chitinophaga sp. TaxID=339340 RepID=UPI0026027F39|nr:AraC family transcriptional regulator [uncultured Chitinophaga sp.]